MGLKHGIGLRWLLRSWFQTNPRGVEAVEAINPIDMDKVFQTNPRGVEARPHGLIVPEALVSDELLRG